MRILKGGNMSKDELPINFASFLMVSVVPKRMEKNWLGTTYIRLGQVLNLSAWLYETGAILGRIFKKRITSVLKTFEYEDKLDSFTNYWETQARKRLDAFTGNPTSFPIFVISTDLNMYFSASLDDFMKLANKKLMAKEGEALLQTVNTSMIEGIMFGTIYPDITLKILKNEYENIDMSNWKEARKYGVSLPENPSIKTVADKEKEVTLLFKDYSTEYHPGLIKELKL